MKYVPLLLLFLSFPGLAQSNYSVDINILDLCPPVQDDCLVLKTPLPTDNAAEELQKNISTILQAQDPSEQKIQEMCQSLRNLEKVQSFKPITVQKTDQDGEKWNITFYFGYTRTEYFNSDVKLRSSRVNVDIKDFEWNERHSFEYFKAEKLKGKGNTFRFIDEPTNTFWINFEKNNNIITFSLLHYKYVMERNQVKHVTGTIDGVYVDKEMPVREEFDGYNNQPGQMHLVRLENTYQQINPQIGYGRKLNIVSSPKYGTLSYTPYAQVGILAGDSYSAFIKQGEYWVADNNDSRWGYKGTTLSAGHKLQYEKGRVSGFIDHKITTSKVKQDFLQDGTATYRLNFMPVTLGIGLKLYKKKNNLQAK